MNTSTPSATRPLAPFSVRRSIDPPPPPPNTAATPPLFSVHVCEDKPLWFAMSRPGTSAMSAPWSTGAWHRLRRMPNAHRKLASSKASLGKTSGFASNADSFNRDHVPRTYESYPAAASSSWVPVSSATSSALQNRGASSCAGSAFTYAAHLDLSPMDLSWRSWSATAIQPASSPQCAPIGDASAVSTVIHSDRGIASTASPPPMSSAATRPHPRPPGAASTIAGDTLLTSTPSDPSHAQSASKSACVRESTDASTATARGRRWESGGGARRLAADGRLRLAPRGAT
mmetsp:Transcript_1352/g.5522  ORF Transcript_1352/g.5522 Transcript_1352/m.5522 type:complete len:287 (+) Transcript_1352:700-1560(+)